MSRNLYLGQTSQPSKPNDTPARPYATAETAAGSWGRLNIRMAGPDSRPLPAADYR